MDKAVLIKLISCKEQFTVETLQCISQLKNEYPYFQTLHLLTLKNKFVLGKDDWKQDVDPVSAYVPDRMIIYDLLYPLELIDPCNNYKEQGQTVITDMSSPGEDVSASKTTATPTLRDNISNLLAIQIEEFELIDPEEAELVPELSIDFDRSYGLDNGINDLLVLDTEQEDEDSKPGKTQLIDRFIENNPKLVPRNEDQPQIDISEESVKEHDGIFTDTLAKIYVKQGYYNKAIFTYEKLILKFPEKSDYFAGQIEAIKKLTNK
jgi:tetratricopeptide (TPR) repeat protein